MATALAPMAGKSTSISVTTTSASASVSDTCPQVRLYNSGTVIVFVRWGKGAQTAVTTDMALAPGAIENFTKQDADTIAAITASGSATLYITPGTGD